jgi:hypothetical protein
LSSEDLIEYERVKSTWKIKNDESSVQTMELPQRLADQHRETVRNRIGLKSTTAKK